MRLPMPQGASYVAIQKDDQRLLLYDSGSDYLDTDYSINTLVDGWHNLIVVSDEGDGEIDFYLDGQNVGKVAKSPQLFVQSIGNLIEAPGKFADKIDDFRIYNRTLAVSEVAELYGNGNGDFGVHPYQDYPPSFDNVPVLIPPTGPLVYWTFNELNGTSVSDISGNDNHGIVDDNLSTPDLFENSVEGREGTAMYFDGNDTLVLNPEYPYDSFNILSPFSVCLWVHTEDLDSVLLESGRFSIIVSDGFLYGQVRIGGTWRQTESMALPSGQWFHLILLWDGNKVKLYKNNELSHSVECFR